MEFEWRGYFRRTGSYQESRGPGACDVSVVAGGMGKWACIILWNPLPELMNSSTRAVFARVEAENPLSTDMVIAALNDLDVQKRPPVAGGG
jgi:hypothetical protein